MRHNHLITPDGTSDLLYTDCAARYAAEKAVCKLFARSGYSEVRTPELEFYDVFGLDSEPIPIEQMYKLTDKKGRLLVLRPDNTMPIARMVSTKLRKAQRPLRLYYNQPCFRMSDSLRGESDRISQCGIELIGAGGIKADIEVLVLAMDALSACVDDFRLEIGNAAIFKCLISALPADEHRRSELTRCIESKNYAALSENLDELEETEAVRMLRQLPRLFGGADVIEKAKALVGDAEIRAQLDYLGSLYAALEQMGCGDRVIIDLGLVNQNDYYTGMIFSAYAQGAGERVLGGGRYDNLLANFGESEPACGFAVYVDSLVKALGTVPTEPAAVPEILVMAKDGCETQALRHMAQLRREGHTVELSLLDDADDAEKYALSRHIGRLDVVTDSVRSIKIQG